jgi:hypothetical protein
LSRILTGDLNRKGLLIGVVGQKIGVKNIILQKMENMGSMEEIQKRHLQHMKEEQEVELAENAGYILSFKMECDRIGIELQDSYFEYIPAIGVVCNYPNIVSHLCPDIVRDKEGLVDFKFLSTRFEKRPFASGFFYSSKYMLMAHPYFRRGFAAGVNFAPRFVDLFWKSDRPDIDSYIAIDYDRVRININNIMYLEEDTWYGARFNDNIAQIPYGPVKLRPPSDLEDFLISFYFDNAYALDIKWETKLKDGVLIKVFYAEEFKTEKITIVKDGNSFYPVRYIHAEFDLTNNRFRHFDGAIHFYTETEYYTRRDIDFNYNAKNSLQIKTNSEKLFKMNGPIDVNTFVEFTSHFLTGNPLVFEYFEDKYPSHVSEMIDAVRKNKS